MLTHSHCIPGFAPASTQAGVVNDADFSSRTRFPTRVRSARDQLARTNQGLLQGTQIFTSPLFRQWCRASSLVAVARNGRSLRAQNERAHLFWGAPKIVVVARDGKKECAASSTCMGKKETAEKEKEILFAHSSTPQHKKVSSMLAALTCPKEKRAKENSSRSSQSQGGKRE